MSSQRMMSAIEACEALSIDRATLYSYVSRGLIRSEAANSSRRERQYSAEDVAKLKARKHSRRDPEAAARETLRWGMPVMESALTLITPDGHYYRGTSALELVQHSTFESVACLLWGEILEPQRTPSAQSKTVGLEVSPIARMIAALVSMSDHDPLGLVRACAAALIGDLGEGSIAEAVARAWGIPDHAHLIESALILCADHELNASAFAVRVAASTDADLRYALIAGLAALSGTKHGGAAQETLRLFEMVGSPERAGDVVTDMLNAGERIPGFGHRLYPDGDPRARLLMRLIREAYPNAPVVVLADAIIASVHAITGLYPNVDYALALLERAANLPTGSAVGLFAMGRSAGWIAHALEQYAAKTLIRPRARYTGIAPEAKS